MSQPKKKPRSLWTTTVHERESPLAGLAAAAPRIVVSSKARERSRNKARVHAQPFLAAPTEDFLSKRAD